MSDIVDRLRATANDTKGFYGRLYCEAADEIEQLRKTLRAVYDWCGYDAPDHEEIERVLAGEKTHER